MNKFSIRFALLIALALLFGACAVIDTSTLDTAIPVPHRHVEVSYYNALGLDLYSLVYSDYDEMEDNENVALPMPVNGFNFGYGLTEDAEIGARFWTSFLNVGGRAYLKYLLNHENNSYVAIVPGITYIFRAVDKVNDDYVNTKSFGPELQLLYTYRHNQFLSFTLAARGNINQITEQIDFYNDSDEINGPYLVYHGGVRGNFELRLGKLLFIPELGAELVNVRNGKLTLLPTTGVSLGLEL